MIKKFLLGVGIFVFIFGIFSLSSVSAGFGDWFKSITGRATSDTFTLNITVGNTAPNITRVDRNVASVSLSEGSSASFIFNFTAWDADGFGNLNDSSAQGRVYASGEITRYNLTCSNIADFDTNYANYSCNVDLWYFDAATTWTINATIDDINGGRGENSTVTFTYTSDTALVSNPSLTWPTISTSDTNTAATNNPLLVNNTLNANIVALNITAIDLEGEGAGAGNYIFAGNFSSSNSTDGCSGNNLVNGTSLNITGATLPRGNNSLAFSNETSGQEQLYFCINAINNLPSASYSTTTGGAWTVGVGP